jgi:hypothetical protein
MADLKCYAWLYIDLGHGNPVATNQPTPGYPGMINLGGYHERFGHLVLDFGTGNETQGRYNGITARASSGNL